MPLSRQAVITAIAERFPAAQTQGILRLLDHYEGKERERVQICILMLSDNSIDDIKHYVQQATADYRDILYWADPDGKLA